jgi:hypothetical protein
LHSALAARELEYVLTVVRGAKSRLKKCDAKFCALYTMQQLHARSQKEKSNLIFWIKNGERAKAKCFVCSE